MRVDFWVTKNQLNKTPVSILNLECVNQEKMGWGIFFISLQEVRVAGIG